MSWKIFFVERNIHGAWSVWGALGVKQYYGYTKKQAIDLYLKEVDEKIITNKKGEKQR